MHWRTAAASVIGTSHVKSEQPCQDFSQCVTIGDTLICAVADGAGSASLSDVGAKIAVTRFIDTFGTASEIDHASMAQWLDSLVNYLGQEANDRQAETRDYACTLLGVIAMPNHTFYFQIGDGAIVVPSYEAGAYDWGAYDWVFWPQNGEYANLTNFATQRNAKQVFEFREGPAVSEIAIFSDGIEHLVLNEATRRVHAPALRPIFDWLRTSESDAAGSQALQTYLGSDHINNRTDDDKSLLMAIRL
jgi:Protein phosphatase 2C